MNLNSTQRKKSGSTIVVVIAIMATLMVVVGVAVEYTGTVSRHVQRGNTLQNAVAIADGSIDQLFAYWREICRVQSNIAKKTEDFVGIPLPTASVFPGVPANFSATANNYVSTSNTTIQQYKVIAVDPQLQPMGANLPPTPATGQNAETKTFNYLATAYVTLPAVRGNLVAKVQRVFSKEQISPWNWAIFYVDPLEIHPGPPFDVTGWVHTNAVLYTATDKLTFMDKVTYGIDWERNWKNGDPRLPGGPTPQTPKDPSYQANLPPALAPAQQPFGLDSTRIFNTTDTNPNNDSYHELIEPPTAGFSDPLADSRYYNQAGVIIQIDGSNNVTFKKRNSDGTETAITSASTGANKYIYDMVNDAVTTGAELQDNRENARVRLATLDIEKLGDEDAYEYANFNGIIYIHDTSAAANGIGAKRGIRLKNGKEIPPVGLTVASNNPVYVQGDFNTGSNPPSNYGDPTRPEGSGYDRRPCSIIADAVNILSNNWNDSKLLLGLSSRIASNTTVNAAIVSGIVPTASNIYSGGAENFPRFLEHWADPDGSGGQQAKTFTYYGSMVQLYRSRQSIGSWIYGANVYEAPDRHWYFDNNFKISTPPGSLMVYSYVKGRWAIAP